MCQIKKKFLLILCMLGSLFLLGCGSVRDENQYIDAYDENQKIVEQNAEIAGDEYVDKTQQVYDDAMDEIMTSFYGETNETNEEEGNFLDRTTEKLIKVFYNRFGSLRSMAPIIAIISFFIGGIIFIFSRKNKPRRRFAVYGLMIGIPVLLVILVYGVGIMSQVFLY